MEKIKRIIQTKVVIFSFVLLLAGGNIYYNDTPVHADTTVYITRTGEKYHTHKCGNGNYFPSSLSSAKAMGLTACSKCFPYGAPSNSSGSNGSGGSSTPKKTTKPIKINKTSVLLVKGKSVRLKIKNATQKVKWASTKTSVATVSSSGKVTAKKAGKAVITATVGSQKKKCTVKVESPKLNSAKIVMKVGETKTLKLKGCKHSVKWWSANSDIVKVAKGKLKAKDTGTTKIKVKVHGKTYSCKVTVKRPDVAKIWLNPSNITLNAKQTYTIRYISNPESVLDYYNATWKSENESVVQIKYSEYDYVDVYTVGVGETDITMTVGGKTAKCHVIVQ